MSTPRGGLIDGKHGFCELVALDQLRALLEKFTKTTGLVAWVASYPEQEPLIDGWRTICGDFHCGSSGSERRCRESRAQLVASLSESGRTVIRACGNGLNDGAVPIVVRGVRAATVLAGQVLFEAPDRDRFRRQAEAHGYDVGAYLAALEEVPVVSEAEFRRSLAFLADVVEAMAERGLRELERGGSAELAERQRITLHSIVDAVIATDADGRVVDMNPVAETLTGWRLEQAAGKELAEIFVLVNAHTRSPVANPVDHVIESGAVVGMANHTILIARGGRELQIADSAAPIRDASGRILGVVMVFRDVTEEYARQEELQRALRFNEALLYAIPTPVFFKGADGRYWGAIVPSPRSWG